jgi:hypothetical protein
MSFLEKENLVVHYGECHCGEVKIEVIAPENITVQICNCSICEKKGFIHLIVPKSKFKIVKGTFKFLNYNIRRG